MCQQRDYTPHYKDGSSYYKLKEIQRQNRAYTRHVVIVTLFIFFGMFSAPSPIGLVTLFSAASVVAGFGLGIVWGVFDGKTK